MVAVTDHVPDGIVDETKVERRPSANAGPAGSQTGESSLAGDGGDEEVDVPYRHDGDDAVDE